jgi:IS1 family transposase
MLMDAIEEGKKERNFFGQKITQNWLFYALICARKRVLTHLFKKGTGT